MLNAVIHSAVKYQHFYFFFLRSLWKTALIQQQSETFVEQKPPVLTAAALRVNLR